MLIYDEGEGLGWGRRAVGGGKGIWKGEGGGRRSPRRKEQKAALLRRFGCVR